MRELDDISEILDDMEPAEGHFDRFMEKANPPKRIEFQRNNPRKRIFWKAVLFPVAASVMMIFGANLLIRIMSINSESFSKTVSVMEDPQDIYNAYMDVVRDSYEYLSSLTAYAPNNGANEHFNTLESITSEYIPLLEVLPDEISEHEKAEILKEYYSRRVESVVELRKYVASLTQRRIQHLQ